MTKHSSAGFDVNENISRVLERLDKLEHTASVLLKNTALVNEVVSSLFIEFNECFITNGRGAV